MNFPRQRRDTLQVPPKTTDGIRPIAWCVKARNWWLGCICLALLWPTPTIRGEEQQPLPETAVISAYLVNFLHFVEWPEEAFESPQTPYRLCIIGPEDLSKTLESMAQGQERRGRGMSVQVLKDLSEVGTCHVLYIDPVVWADLEGDFEGVLQTPLLTVGRRPDFLDAGGGINLLAVDKRLRFEVDRDALEACGLKVDSRLLDAAIEVRQRKRRRRPR